MNKKFKIVELALLGIVIVGAVTGWLLWNKPHKDVEDATAIEITAIDLYNSYSKDSVNAKRKYTNKIVEIAGTTTQVSKNQLSQTIILLKTSTENAFINCTMEGNVVDTKPGIKVSIKGICNGYNGGDADMGIPGDVILVRCYRTN